MISTIIRCLLPATLLLLASLTQAAVRLPRLVGSNMVLQRNTALPIWGWAAPGERVVIIFQGHTYRTPATDTTGRWRIMLPPLRAGGPYSMLVKGHNTIQLSNILVGDVWLASGQSNMEWPLQEEVLNFRQEIAAANYPRIRLLTVEKVTAASPQADFASDGWQECGPQTVGRFSAVAYFFGRSLHQHYHVPIGLISAVWSGTAAESWVSPATLRTLPGQPQHPFPTSGQAEFPSIYNAMIAPLLPYALKGIIWYQGESNVSRAYQYRTLFPALIQDWRTRWGQGNLPFLFVQLAGYMRDQPEPAEYEWAELREAQLRTLAVPSTGMAVALDLGDPNDIHPRNKQPVGERLALAARRVAYHDSGVVASGPLLQAMRVQGNTVRLRFSQTGGGLVLKDPAGPYLRGFALAGADQKFVWAQGRLEGQELVLYSDQVPTPVAVRYAWGNSPFPNLYNAEGLPASPFRTDDWPGLTTNR
ncbi:sialate O-acetylesterase [Hymenobacter elongatus]|uniref:Sialate O-acetylesterase n=1 Tax=Hymenobacter elongatus TaxID=877208 RepID=A0A4Z0PJR6_9BACT|nr:sialate O-acetylesterase [Hymenobacter elongatus]TGE15922.1 sialate O-acetylesterase [Hymenobacter elongatus]